MTSVAPGQVREWLGQVVGADLAEAAFGPTLAALGARAPGECSRGRVCHYVLIFI